MSDASTFLRHAKSFSDCQQQHAPCETCSCPCLHAHLSRHLRPRRRASACVGHLPDHPRSARLQQAIGEAASGHAQIERHFACRIDPRCMQRMCQFGGVHLSTPPSGIAQPIEGPSRAPGTEKRRPHTAALVVQSQPRLKPLQVGALVPPAAPRQRRLRAP